MICAASSKHKSMRFARMWNSKSPAVATAWRPAARISRNACSSAGRGAPKSRSHASDPNPMTQERPPSISRNSTARNSAARSPQNARTVSRCSGPGFIVRTRKMAARVKGAATDCASARTPCAASGFCTESESIERIPGEACRHWMLEISEWPSNLNNRPASLPSPPSEIPHHSVCVPHNLLIPL